MTTILLLPDVECPPELPCALPNTLLGIPVFTGQTGPENGSLEFEVFDRIEQIGPRLWEQCFPPHWKDYAYHQTLQETFAIEFPQRYLVLRAPGKTGAVCAIQPFFLVEQDLTAGLGPRMRAALGPIRLWLKMRLLMVGCIVGEGRIGVRAPFKAEEVCHALDDALRQYATHQRIPIVLFKDFPAPYRSVLAGLVKAGGYARLPSLPAVGLELDFATFDEYLRKRLGKSTRKSLRRKFKDFELVTVAAPVTLEVKQQITEEEAFAAHALYERIALRGDVQFEVFSKEYFQRLAKRMPERTRFFLWRQSGKIIAFSFCVVDGDAIHDNDIGLDESLAADLHLYHVTFRDIITWALAHGLKHYYSAPFNYQPKLHLRMHLVPLDLYARHASPLVNFLLRHVAPALAPTRQEPLLKQFANAPEITSCPSP